MLAMECSAFDCRNPVPLTECPPSECRGTVGVPGIPGLPSELKTALSQEAFLEAPSLYSLDSAKVLTYLLCSAIGFVYFGYFC